MITAIQVIIDRELANVAKQANQLLDKQRHALKTFNNANNRGNGMFLSKRQKSTARQIAAQVWNEVNAENLTLTPGARLDLAKQRTRDRIRDERALKGQKVGFGWEAIIVSLMTRIALKLLTRWLEKRLFSVSEDGIE